MFSTRENHEWDISSKFAQYSGGFRRNMGSQVMPLALLVGMFALFFLGCTEGPEAADCQVGQEGCDCDVGGVCADGLQCDASRGAAAVAADCTKVT